MKVMMECGLGFYGSAGGPVFWEYLYERVRRLYFDKCPSRYDSYFTFKTLEDITAYKEKHGASGVICRVDISNCHTVFECDMSILDEIDHSYGYAKAEEAISKYWKQERSSCPITEVLLQGEIKFLDLLS